MDAPYHSSCGTLKNPYCSIAISAEHRSKFAVLHRQWLRLQMSENISSGRKNYKLTNKQKILYVLFFTKNFREKVDVNYKSVNNIDIIWPISRNLHH